MKKRLTATALALSSTLIIAGTALAHWTYNGPNWKGTPGGSGYQYYIPVCESGFSANSRARLQDAMTEWNEIGGELFMCLLADGTNCQSVYDGIPPVIWASLTNLSENLLASTSCRKEILSGKLEDCRMYVTSDQYLVAGTCSDLPPGTFNFTWYTGTGSPTSTQIDVESIFVHELGHTLAVGHNSGDYEDAIMDDRIQDNSGSPPECDPRAIEKDERVLSHDTSAYTQFYGTTH